MTLTPDILRELRRPPAPASVGWKIQSAKYDNAVIVGYVDARFVLARLNAVVGLNWSDAYTRDGAGVVCALTVGGVTRCDTGFTEHNVDSDLGRKTAYSDAFKRAAVKFGVAECLYDMPTITLPKAQLRVPQNGKPSLTRANRADLTRRYAAWVTNAKIVETFGALAAVGVERGVEQAA